MLNGIGFVYVSALVLRPTSRIAFSLLKHLSNLSSQTDDKATISDCFEQMLTCPVNLPQLHLLEGLLRYLEHTIVAFKPDQPT
jgi:hypothetical protein